MLMGQSKYLPFSVAARMQVCRRSNSKDESFSHLLQFCSVTEDIRRLPGAVGTSLCSSCTWLRNIQVTVKRSGFSVPEHRIRFLNDRQVSFQTGHVGHMICK